MRVDWTWSSSSANTLWRTLSRTTEQNSRRSWNARRKSGPARNCGLPHRLKTSTYSAARAGKGWRNSRPRPCRRLLIANPSSEFARHATCIAIGRLRLAFAATVLARDRNTGQTLLFADPSVAVPIAHVLVGGMAALHRRDSMVSRFCAGNSAVSVVVPKFQCVRSG